MNNQERVVAPTTTTCLWVMKNIRHWPIQSYHELTINVRGMKCHIRVSFCHGSSMGLFLDFSCEKGTSSDDLYILECSLIDKKFSQRYKQCKSGSFENGAFILKFAFEELCFEEPGMLHFDRNLVAYFQITVYNNFTLTVFYNNDTCADFDPRNVTASFLRGEYLSDFVVRVKDKEFKCHRFLLAFRSEYFAAMFRHRMKENIENKLTLDDVDPDIFQKVLRFIYTDEADMCETDALHLFAAAHKFHLPRLMAMCEAKLYSSLSLENASEVFSFAKFYDLLELEQKASLILTHFLKRDSGMNFRGIDPIPLRHCCFLNVTAAGDALPTNHRNKPIDETSRVTMGDTSHSDSTVENKDRQAFTFQANVWHCAEYQVLPKKKWTIRNFLGYADPFTGAIGTRFHTAASKKANWLIEIREENGHIFFRLKLIRCKKGEGSLSVRYRFSILNTKQRETNVVDGAWELPLNEYHKVNFIPKSHISTTNELLHDGNFIVCYSFLVRESSLHCCRRKHVVPEGDLVAKFGSLLNERLFTDVVVSVQGENFPCHKAILAFYSPFFDSVCERNSEEGLVEIYDLKPNTFKGLLSVMYTGKCELTGSEILELIPVANKYGFFDKTTAFDGVFISALSVLNAVKTLISVHCENATKLKAHTMQFVLRNLLEIVTTPDWPELASYKDLHTECWNEFIAHASGKTKNLSKTQEEEEEQDDDDDDDDDEEIGPHPNS